MNRITVHGRLARNPELKDVKGKDGPSCVCNFTVAANNSFRDEASFFNCFIFAKKAEVIDKFFKKGSEIVVYGEMQQENYTNKDGQKVYGWKLRVEQFDFCGSKKDGNSNPDSSVPDGFEPIDDEDIPF